MEFWEIMKMFLFFFQENILISIAFVCVLLFLLYWKPKVFLIIVFITLLLLGIFYIISDVSTTGLSHKEKLIQGDDLL
jgi:hypothetical protein